MARYNRPNPASLSRFFALDSPNPTGFLWPGCSKNGVKNPIVSSGVSVWKTVEGIVHDFVPSACGSCVPNLLLPGASSW